MIIVKMKKYYVMIISKFIKIKTKQIRPETRKKTKAKKITKKKMKKNYHLH